MDENNFTVSLRPISAEVIIIDVYEALTTAAEPEMMAAFNEATENGARIILFGFERLTYLNSAGIGLLVRLVIRAQRQEQQILAFGLREHYRRIFELTRLQEVIRVFDNEAEALASLAVDGHRPQYA